MARVNIEEDIDEGFYMVYAPYNEDFKEDLKAEFRARWDPDNKAWKVSMAMYSRNELMKLLRLHFPRDC